VTLPPAGIDWDSTPQLRADVARLLTAFPDTNTFLSNFVDRFEKLSERTNCPTPVKAVSRPFLEAVAALYRAEQLTSPPPPFSPVLIHTMEGARYRDQLLGLHRKAVHPDTTLELLHWTLMNSFLALIDNLPALAFIETESNDTSVPILDIVDVNKTITEISSHFLNDGLKLSGLFAGLRAQLLINQLSASGNNPKKLLTPSEFKGSPREKVNAYLRDTPLLAVFDARIPFFISDDQRFEHTHVIAGSGHGKTQFLQHLIFNDLLRPDPPSLIVIDSQGEMLRKIQDLAIFAKHPERLIIIDPEQYSPALNMFDTTNTRVKHYSELHREQLQAGIIELYNYIFASIAAEMTSRQSTAFAFVARLMLAIPGSTIHTLRELMEDGAQSIEQSSFRDDIERLEPTARSYFRSQFFTKRYSDLKQQIARRLYGVLSVPAFDRMFSASRNSLDMFEAMQSGKVVLVNTSKSLLKSDASALFGRYMIALVIRAVYERVAATNRHPAFLIVDEASEYFDDNIQLLLEQARKFNVGLVLAHQHLDQLSTGLRSAIAANTAIKLAGGVNDRDARALAPDMRTSAEFINGMRKKQRSAQFACYVRNLTDQALQLEVPFGTLEGAPAMTEADRGRLIERNRQLYAVSREPSRPAATKQVVSSADPVPGSMAMPERIIPPVDPTSGPKPEPPVSNDDWRS